jgi:hypothetical protein
MRRPTLLLLPLLAGCGGEPDPMTYVVIDDFVAGATPVHCEPVSLEWDPSPVELRLASDSTWTVLDELQRQIVQYDDALRVVRRLELPAAGPGSAPRPVSLARLGDSAWAVAVRGGLRIVILSDRGAELGSIPLDFLPHSLEALPTGDLLLTALPLGDRPPTLVVRWDGVGFTPLAVPRRSYTDMTVNALGNSALLEVMPGGEVLVMHQFLEPRAFRIGPADLVSPLTPPTPDGTREAIPYVPSSPITEAQMPLTLLPAMAMTVDPGSGDVFVLTRSGRTLGSRPERAVLRLDRELAFIEGFLLDVAPSSMVVLPRTRTAVVVDEADAFYACPLSGEEARHAGDG